MSPNWFIDIIRILFRYIDYVVYGLVNLVYQLFIMISEISIFSNDTMKAFSGRIYALLGVFMLFKVSFSLITYILNPDSLTDKSKGAGKLLTNFFVVLIGIIVVPYAFQAAYSLQGIVLKENVIGNVIMGMTPNTVSEGDAADYIEQGGKMMSFATLSGFLRLNPEVVGEECAFKPVEMDTSGTYSISSACDVSSYNIETVFVKAYADNNVNALLPLVDIKVQDSDGNDAYLFEYTIVISTIAGGFLAWILLLFCIDIAVRSVKLGFLQLIAPIPLISYIDPKGQDVFNKWLKECGKTYGDIFVRLAAIYFAIFIITNLDFVNITTGQPTESSFGMLFVKIFIIFGALLFAKQLPDLIYDILGIKGKSGGFTLNPMKKLGASPYSAGLVGAVGGAVGGMAANTWALGSRIKKDGFKKAMTDGQTGFKGFTHAVGNTFTGLAGAGSAGVRGMKAGFTSGGKGSLFDGAAKGIKASSQARNLRDKGYGIGDKFKDKATDLAGVKFATGTTSHLKNEINQLQEQLNNAKRNEQSYSDVLARRIGEANGRDAAALRRLFNGEVASWDSRGNVEAYASRTYDDYRMAAAEQEAIRAGEDWGSMDDARKQVYVQTAEYNGMMSEEDFNTLTELYNERNSSDIQARQYQKQINDYQDDMNRFKDRNKGN